MKVTYLLALMHFLCVTAIAQNGIAKKQGFHINGIIKNIPDAEKIYLFRGDKVDSAVVKKGEFSFKGDLDVPSVVNLYIKYLNRPVNRNVFIQKDNLSMFLSAGKNTITIDDQFNQAIISYSYWQKEYEALSNDFSAFFKSAGEINRAYQKASASADLDALKVLKPRVDSIKNREREFVCAYIQKNPKSPVNLFAIEKFGRQIVNANDIEPAYELLSDELKNTSLGKQFLAKIKENKKLGLGVVLPDFEQPDTLGNMVRLSDFRGKYVFVDLWASWCGPCRTQIPYVKLAAEEFSSKNFLVLAVSLDGSREDWFKAIREDASENLLHVGDMLDRKNAVALLYNIKSIPRNFLLDPSGKIIGKDLHDLELVECLKELSNKNLL